MTVEISIHPDFINKDEPQNKINEQIIRLINENNHIRRKEMAVKLGCSISTIKRAFADLKEERIIYEGSSKKVIGLSNRRAF